MLEEGESCYRIFAEIEAQRKETLAMLGEWGPRRASFRPAADCWCAVEVLDHVVRAETGVIGKVRANLREPQRLSRKDRPGVAALDGALRSDRRFHVPTSAIEIHPDSETTLAEVAERWESSRMELGRLIEGLGPEDVECGVFQHPFAGWMTVGEVLDHFSAHLYHHGFQLERLRVGAEG